jgi:hypothetical protein
MQEGELRVAPGVTSLRSMALPIVQESDMFSPTVLDFQEHGHIFGSLFNNGKEVVECLIVSRRSRHI